MVINISYWEGSGALIAKAEQKVMLERKREREREREIWPWPCTPGREMIIIYLDQFHDAKGKHTLTLHTLLFKARLSPLFLSFFLQNIKFVFKEYDFTG